MSANSADIAASKNIVKGGRGSRIGLRTVALGYLAALLLVPVIMIVFKAFEDGVGNVLETLTTPEAMHAFWLTLVMVAVAIPLNTIFGVACALVLVRDKFRGKWFLNALIDLPFAISPVVIGLALILVYGSVDGVFGQWLIEHGIRVIFTPIGMAIATTFVSLPFVVREIEPVLREIGNGPGAGSLDAWRKQLADVLANHAAGDPVGPDLRRGACHGARPRRVRRGLDRLRADLRRDRDAAALRPEAVRGLQRLGRLCRRTRPRDHRAGDAGRHEPCP